MIRFGLWSCCFALLTLTTCPLLAGEQVELFPDSEPLEWQGDLAERMMNGAHRLIERKIDESLDARAAHWQRDFSTRENYDRSIAPNRARLRQILGVIDERLTPTVEIVQHYGESPVVAETEQYTIRRVRWPVLPGVDGEGLLAEPRAASQGYIIALPDADHTPEQLLGLADGVPRQSQFARHLAENGWTVIVPVLVNRETRFSGRAAQTNREWIYRQAFHMGRHVIGYEAQKVLALVDWCHQQSSESPRVGVVGYGEGGLVAFYAAAIEPRIDAVLVSGYFQSRQKVWSEPIYRNVWGLLREFGDAEIVTLIAPRPLVVEYSAVPDRRGHSLSMLGNLDVAQSLYGEVVELQADKGLLLTPTLDNVRGEFDRAQAILPEEYRNQRLVHGEGRDAVVPFGSPRSLELFVSDLGGRPLEPASAIVPQDRRSSFDPASRQQRQVLQLERHVQELVEQSHLVRDEFLLNRVFPQGNQRRWSTRLEHETFSAEEFAERVRPYRDHLWEEVLGRFDDEYLPPRPRIRAIFDEPAYTGYEVVLDVYPDLFAWGYLLVPKNLQEGERRPVVVVQHGRGGLPRTVIDEPSYNRVAPRLAERGFVVFAPHNLYRGEDRYRWLDRKANSVKASLFSFILAQHEQILRWLAGLSFVDPNRIGFYGKSYGGETAVRVPPLLEGYALSICSADFNDWARKVASTEAPYSFMYTIEWEMPYFDMGQTFNYAELVYLMVPRPFMVERGHHDLVAPDSWVAAEYAKVRALYAQLGIADRTEIEFFNGGHAMNLEGTMRFLERHLGQDLPSVAEKAAR